MDIEQIQQLGVFEYAEAVNYSATTYKLRSMGSTKKKKSKSDNIAFNQPLDYDIDPNFVKSSQFGKVKK